MSIGIYLDRVPAWAINGTVQMPAIPAHTELTPEQARAFAWSLVDAADRADLYNKTLAQMASRVIRRDEDWHTAYSDAIGVGKE